MGVTACARSMTRLRDSPASRAISMPKAESATPGTMLCRKTMAPSWRGDGVFAARARWAAVRPAATARENVWRRASTRRRARRDVRRPPWRWRGRPRCRCRARSRPAPPASAAVACCRMVAVSTISTMKVDWPRGQVVLRADAGEDAVDQPDRAPRRPARTSRSAPAARSAPPGADRSILPAMFGPVRITSARVGRRAGVVGHELRRPAGCARPPDGGRRRCRSASLSSSIGRT